MVLVAQLVASKRNNEISAPPRLAAKTWLRPMSASQNSGAAPPVKFRLWRISAAVLRRSNQIAFERKRGGRPRTELPAFWEATVPRWQFPSDRWDTIATQRCASGSAQS